MRRHRYDPTNPAPLCQQFELQLPLLALSPCTAFVAILIPEIAIYHGEDEHGQLLIDLPDRPPHNVYPAGSVTCRECGARYWANEDDTFPPHCPSCVAFHYWDDA